MRSLLGCSLVLGGICVSGVAAAQPASHVLAPNNGDGFDTHLFRPAMDSKGFFTVNGSDVLGHQDISFGLVIDYGRTLLRVANFSSQGQKSAQLINDSFQGIGTFSYGLFNRLIVGLDLPVNLMAGDANVNAAGMLYAPFDNNNQIVGNQLNEQEFAPYIGLHGKWRILRADDGLGVALGLHVGLPTGDSSKNFGADPTVWAWPMVIVEKPFGRTDQFRLAANVGYRVHGASSTVLSLADGTYRDGSLLTYGLAASYRVIDPLDIVAETYGTYVTGSADSGVALSNEVVGGIKVFVERNSYLLLGAGPRYTTGFEAADFRGFVGFIFEPSIGDRDGDGIKDDVDQCPDQPEDRDHFKDEDGCPDPDNDNDGIPDVDDRCPNEPEDRDGDHDEDGCPEATDGDRDGDGVPDSKDACPDTPGVKTNDPRTNGCPPPPPPKPDRDHDGIPDDQDACPDQAGPPNPDPKLNGCPPEQKGPIKIENNQLTSFDKIKFATASAEILPESDKLLDDIAATMKGHPEFLLFEVGGHADERGPEGYNLQLTQARVDSVVRALVGRGVEASRLRSKGYGLYCPEDPGHNEAAWNKNRRVEFKILKTTDGPTGVEQGCATALAHGVKPDPVQ
jgi:outer membrane protein OmpA-like peptidoglycan-associated protein